MVRRLVHGGVSVHVGSVLLAGARARLRLSHRVPGRVVALRGQRVRLPDDLLVLPGPRGVPAQGAVLGHRGRRGHAGDHDHGGRGADPRGALDRVPVRRVPGVHRRARGVPAGSRDPSRAEPRLQAGAPDVPHDQAVSRPTLLSQAPRGVDRDTALAGARGDRVHGRGVLGGFGAGGTGHHDRSVHRVHLQHFRHPGPAVPVLRAGWRHAAVPLPPLRPGRDPGVRGREDDAVGRGAGAHARGAGRGGAGAAGLDCALAVAAAAGGSGFPSSTHERRRRPGEGARAGFVRMTAARVPNDPLRRRALRRRVWPWVAGGLAVGIAGWIGHEAATWPDVATLARHSPEGTAFIERYQRRQRAAGRSDAVRWDRVPDERISPHLKRAVVAAEDMEFFFHHGFSSAELKDALTQTLPKLKTPPPLRGAVVGAEDMEFFFHHGFSSAELKDALTQALRKLEAPRGASTITQQLAKNLWLSPSRDPMRKLKEALLTRQLERHLTKRRTLELYLNVAEFGPGIYGAEVASRAFFGKPASDLTEHEAAELAASLPRPSTWHPGRDSRSYARYVAEVERRMSVATFLWRAVGAEPTP